LLTFIVAALSWVEPGSLGSQAPGDADPIAIVAAGGADFQTALAARELRRYLYVRTGRLAKISPTLPEQGQAVLLAQKDDAILKSVWSAQKQSDLDDLAAQQYLIRTIKTEALKMTCIVGGDDTGVLYGAFRFCEHLGIRYYLHGDVIPDHRLMGALPEINEAGKPLFDVRGILPFHDFPEGPDWWSRDDYLGVVSQLARLRMNFIGMHCYPEGGPHAEPLVWIGSPRDLDADGQVNASYPALWASTRRRGNWGYQPTATSDFRGGADQLFASDDYAPEVMSGLLPQPRSAEQQDRLFNRVGALLHDAFSLARQLGVKVAVGTEVPLAVPSPVQQRLKARGQDPRDREVLRELYRGIFSRIMKTHPLDYYWLWTPESWTWDDNRPEQFAATVLDLQAAREALEALGNPFRLATSGWVLGPADDRSALDRILPKTAPMSCINREVGNDLIEPGFAALQGRPKWAIPWLENDPHLTVPQLWAGRMRYDAADARRLGCTGLLGIHWRTRILAPSIAALAAAGWDQSYAAGDWRLPRIVHGKGPAGGKAAFSDHPVAGTGESFLFQSMLEDLDGYELDMPDGVYTVTMKFNEPQFNKAGQRVFDITIQGRSVVEKLDIFSRAGQHHALELSFPEVRVADGEVRIGFSRIVGPPCVSAIVISGKTVQGQSITRKINCGGDVVAGYERDGANDKPGTVERSRTMPLEAFYEDFARANFGESVAAPLGRLFVRLDGWDFPQPATWNDGPGFIAPLHLPSQAFDFVREMAALRQKVSGPGNLERFDYWLNTFRYMEDVAEAGAQRADLDEKMAEAFSAPTAEEKRRLAQEALALRLGLARAWEKMMSQLVAAASTPGELGTIANLEQHTRIGQGFLTHYDQQLAQLLARPLPATASPGRAYRGPARIIVPTIRSEVAPQERLNLQIMAVDHEPVRQIQLHWRPLGQGAFHLVRARRSGRSVFHAVLPSGAQDLEYFLSAETRSAKTLIWPATAPRLCQTVIVLPPPRDQ
jgi:hypothetical protein